jgi:hypothetical protein
MGEKEYMSVCDKISDFVKHESVAREDGYRYNCYLRRFTGPKQFLYAHTSNNRLLALITRDETNVVTFPPGIIQILIGS